MPAQPQAAARPVAGPGAGTVPARGGAVARTGVERSGAGLQWAAASGTRTRDPRPWARGCAQRGAFLPERRGRR